MLKNLKPVNRNKIVAARKAKLEPILSILKLVKTLGLTETGLKVLGQKCEGLLAERGRSQFCMQDLVATIHQRYQLLMGDLAQSSLSQKVENRCLKLSEEEKKWFSKS